MSNYLLLGGFILNGFKELFFQLDKFVYMIARGAYQVFCYISEITLEREDIVTDLTTRIYAILGIFLVFIVTYNLLTYIINPDKISDNKVGASAVIKDIIIALAIIALTPTLFAKLYAFQNTIITSGVISNLVLGGYSSEDVQKYGNGNEQDVGRNYIRLGANNMAANVFTSFFAPANNDFSAIYCNKSSSEVSSNEEIQQKNEEYAEYCVAYANMINTGSLDSFGDLVTSNKYEYWFIFSTIGGIALALFMLSFCLNLAKRVFKLFILQFIAPIPVVMELIPSKKGARERWYKSLIQVYLEVFFFQAVIFIVIYLISLVPNLIIQLFGVHTLSNDAGGWFVKSLTLVFLIVGLLQFGKEAPKMIFDLLGIQSTGIIADAAKRALKIPGIGASAVGTSVTSGARAIGSMVTKIKGASDAREYGSAIAGGIASTAVGFLGGLGYGGYANRSGRIRNINRTIGAASNKVQNAGTRISRPIGALGGQIGRGIRNVPNIPGAVGSGINAARTAGAHPLNTVRTTASTAGRGIKTGVVTGARQVANWATGGNQTGDATRQAIKTFKGIYSAPKFDDDNYIKDRNKDLVKIFTDNGISYDSFVRKSNEWIKAQENLGRTATLSNYLASQDFENDFTQLKDANGDISTVANRIDDINNMISERKDTIRSKDAYSVATEIETLKKAASKDKQLADLIAAAELDSKTTINLNNLSLDPETKDTAAIIKASKYLEDISKSISKIDKKAAYANAGRNQNDNDNNK